MKIRRLKGSWLTAVFIGLLAATASAQRLFEQLDKRHLPANKDATTSTALGDVDGDGDLDLVVGNTSHQQSRLYLNNGNGTFSDATASNMPVGLHSTTSLALGDLDRDGDLDLILGNANQQQSRLYLNNGSGAFTDATAARLPTGYHETESLALGDLDGDGDLDLVLGNANQQQSRLYLNNGAGTFVDATASNLPVGTYETWSLALGDLDRDGDLDLIMGNSGQSRLYLNNGASSFSDVTASRMPAEIYDSTSLALGDVDRDGDLDLLLGNSDWQSQLYLNNGAGTFTNATVGRMPVVGGDTRSVKFGDVDADGDLDLVFGIWGTESRLFLNDGTGTFADATPTRMPVGIYFTTSLTLGDVDLDGDLDLVVGNAGPPIGHRSRLYLNISTGRFTDATASRLPATGEFTTSIALGDVDGDGDLDLVFGKRTSNLYLNDGTGAFMDATATRMPNGSYLTNAVALSDVDRDGDLDLILGNSGAQRGGQSRLYQNNGAGTFTDATASSLPAGRYLTTSLALGDVDRDGDPDLIMGNAGSAREQSRLYLNNGTGTFSDATAVGMPAGTYYTYALALGDLDGDLDLDLVVGNLGEQSRLYLNNGTGIFADATASRMPNGNYATLSLALGDVDADGDLDLVMGVYAGQSLLYLNNGMGTFSDATAASMPADSRFTTSLALGDVDGDGDLDLFLGNGGSAEHQSLLYLNNGIGVFTDATASHIPAERYDTQSLALGDMDQDGDLDLVLGSVRQNSIYQNLRRQLDAPYILGIGRDYQLDVYARHSPGTTGEYAFPMLSAGTANIPLPPFGTIGIDLNQMIALPPFPVPQPAGLGSLTIPIPNVPALAGATIYTQVLLNQPPVQARLTNVIGDVILR